MLRQRLAIMVGARPNFMKAAPVLRELQAHPDEFEPILIHTGQHYDPVLSDVFFRDLGIQTPDIQLISAGANHVQTIANIIRQVSDIFARRRFESVVVFGDVSSTIASAISGSKHGLPLMHVEAGLRSHDRRMPEEINRVITDHISDVLFTSEPSGTENLLAEGIPEDKIHHVGNVMIDTLVAELPSIRAAGTTTRLGLAPRGYVLSTIHRQENVDDAKTLKLVFQTLDRIASTMPLVIPLHPRTRIRLAEAGIESLLARLTVVPPLGYDEFIHLAMHAATVVTDSGGVQEETTWLDIPCITLRDSTERPVTVTHGTNTLVNVSHDDFPERVMTALRTPKHRAEEIPLWDGHAARRIVEVLRRY